MPIRDIQLEKAALARVTDAVRAAMLAADDGALSVPLKVDVGTGANWDEAH